MCFFHKPNLPLAVRQECVLFSVLQRPLEALEGFFDSKNGFLMKFYANLMGHVQIFGFKQMYSLFLSKYGPPHPVYSL